VFGKTSEKAVIEISQPFLLSARTWHWKCRELPALNSRALAVQAPTFVGEELSVGRKTQSDARAKSDAREGGELLF